jgi:hypothetical protein
MSVSKRLLALGAASVLAVVLTALAAAADWSPWSPAVRVESITGSAETRASISKDGTTLYFGSNRPGGDGSTDHYVTTRDRLGGDDHESDAADD